VKKIGSSWDAIDALRTKASMVADDVPANAFSVNEYAKRYRLIYSTAVQQVARLVAVGALKTGKRMGVDAHGRARLMKVYWPA
jgi:hypothetical protein